jgi:RNA polymerase sigma-70 factor (ECF subfamily)
MRRGRDGDGIPVTAPSTAAPAGGVGTSEQVEWLIERFGATLFRVAFSILRDRELAEDVVQEVLLKAWTAMPSWEGDVPVRWARTVTRNTALSHLRAARARPASPTDRLDLVSPAVPGTDEEMIRAERAGEMWAALGRLDPEQRSMLVMHEIDGVSYEEIAMTLGLTVSAVKSRLYRARVALRTEVAR